MKRSILYLFSFLTLQSCNSSDSTKKNEDLDKTFFPIAGTILTELKNIDSLPIAIIKYTVTGESKDTTILKKEDMKAVAEQLTKPDISLPEYKKYYKETVFMDNTTNTITMSYDTEDEKPEVRKIEVIIDANNQRVKSIYVEKLAQHDDSSLLKKMIWTTGKNLQVISIVNKKSEPESVKMEKYEWGIN
jgi:hypothetical protein